MPGRSRSGFLIYANATLVQWFSKKQSTVEISVVGAEFVAMEQDIDALRGLRYTEDNGYSYILSLIYLWG